MLRPRLTAETLHVGRLGEKAVYAARITRWEPMEMHLGTGDGRVAGTVIFQSLTTSNHGARLMLEYTIRQAGLRRAQPGGRTLERVDGEAIP